jgi:hypothetical protein
VDAWSAVWIISDGSTHGACLTAIGASAPALTAYPYVAKVGYVRHNNALSTAKIVGFTQVNRRVWWQYGAVMVRGNSGHPTTIQSMSGSGGPLWRTVAHVVPPAAASVFGLAGTNNTSDVVSVIITPNSTDYANHGRAAYLRLRPDSAADTLPGLVDNTGSALNYAAMAQWCCASDLQGGVAELYYAASTANKSITIVIQGYKL